MTESVNDKPRDHEQQNVTDILVNLPAVRAAKKVNTLSRVGVITRFVQNRTLSQKVVKVSELQNRLVAP